MVNIKFIAKKAKVSVRTVSNVLNKRDSQYSEKTRKKVLRVIKRYDYLPSRIARGLRTGATGTIGFIVPDLSYHPIFSELFVYIEDLLSSSNYNILLFNSKNSLKREIKIINSLIENKVDGILFIRIVKDNPAVKKIPVNIPLVACLRAFESLDVPSVLTDNIEIGRVATEFLIKKGHKKIIHMVGDEDLLAHRERKIGYLETLEKHNIKINKDYLVYSDYMDIRLYEKLAGTFRELKDFTAIFSYDDIVAANCIKALQKISYRVPEDISIIGVNNSNFTNFIEPSLTTIEQPIKEICNKSVDLLLELINNKEKHKEYKNKVFIFEPKFIERESVADLT